MLPNYDEVAKLIGLLIIIGLGLVVLCPLLIIPIVFYILYKTYYQN